MKVIFAPPVLLELSDAVAFYEMQHSGLGVRFKYEVRSAIGRIIEFPEAGPTAKGDVRKAFVRAFPYKVLYAHEGDRIVILAIAHQHRQPDYWVDRS